MHRALLGSLTPSRLLLPSSLPRFSPFLPLHPHSTIPIAMDLAKYRAWLAESIASLSIVRPARSSSNADPPRPNSHVIPLALLMPEVGSVARASCSYSHDYSEKASLLRRAPLFVVSPGQIIGFLHPSTSNSTSALTCSLATCYLLLAHLLTCSPAFVPFSIHQLYLDAPPRCFQKPALV